jgi:hypothetical protein
MNLQNLGRTEVVSVGRGAKKSGWSFGEEELLSAIVASQGGQSNSISVIPQTV